MFINGVVHIFINGIVYTIINGIVYIFINGIFHTFINGIVYIFINGIVYIFINGIVSWNLPSEEKGSFVRLLKNIAKKCVCTIRLFSSLKIFFWEFDMLKKMNKIIWKKGKIIFFISSRNWRKHMTIRRVIILLEKLYKCIWTISCFLFLIMKLSLLRAIELVLVTTFSLLLFLIPWPRTYLIYPFSKYIPHSLQKYWFAIETRRR